MLYKNNHPSTPLRVTRLAWTKYKLCRVLVPALAGSVT